MESLTRLAGLAEPLHAAMGRPDRSGPSPAVAITDQASAPTALRPDLLCWGKLASGWLAETEAKNCHLHKNLDTSPGAQREHYLRNLSLKFTGVQPEGTNSHEEKATPSCWCPGDRRLGTTLRTPLAAPNIKSPPFVFFTSSPIFSPRLFSHSQSTKIYPTKSIPYLPPPPPA